MFSGFSQSIIVNFSGRVVPSGCLTDTVTRSRISKWRFELPRIGSILPAESLVQLGRYPFGPAFKIEGRFLLVDLLVEFLPDAKRREAAEQ